VKPKRIAAVPITSKYSNQWGTSILKYRDIVRMASEYLANAPLANAPLANAPLANAQLANAELANYFNGMNEDIPSVSALRRSSRLTRVNKNRTKKSNNSTRRKNPVKRKRNNNSGFKLSNYGPTHGPNVKYITNPTVSKLNIAKGLKFIDEVANLPLYYVSAHACICPEKTMCYGEMIKPQFTIPKDTYIISFTTPGECYSSLDFVIIKNKDNIRKYLYMNSESDVITGDKVGKTRFSIFSGIRRATSPRTSAEEAIPYPNIGFTMNNSDKEKKNSNENPYGVYNLKNISDPNTELNNIMSILPEDAARKNWALEDIIREVYEKTNNTKGIFVLTGCLDICDNKTQTIKDIDNAATIMNHANNMYPTLRETFTKEDLEKLNRQSNIPKNRGVSEPIAYLEPSEIRNLADKGLMDPKEILKMSMLYHNTDKTEIENIVKQYKGKF